MLNSIINLVLRTRWLVIGATVVLIGAGLWALFTIPVDAFPDLTNNQVVIVTEAPSFPPTEVERQITYPIEIAMLGMPSMAIAMGYVIWRSTSAGGKDGASVTIT